MKHYSPSKSNLFLMELIIDILLFCVLCVCALLLFSKSAKLTRQATELHHAVSLCSGIAAKYQSEDDSLSETSVLYYDGSYQPCEKDSATFYITLTETTSEINKLNIEFYTVGEELIYSMTACKYIPATPATAKEVNGYE